MSGGNVPQGVPPGVLPLGVGGDGVGPEHVPFVQLHPHAPGDVLCRLFHGTGKREPFAGGPGDVRFSHGVVGLCGPVPVLHAPPVGEEHPFGDPLRGLRPVFEADIPLNHRPSRELLREEAHGQSGRHGIAGTEVLKEAGADGVLHLRLGAVPNVIDRKGVLSGRVPVPEQGFPKRTRCLCHSYTSVRVNASDFQECSSSRRVVVSAAEKEEQ